MALTKEQVQYNKSKLARANTEKRMLNQRGQENPDVSYDAKMLAQRNSEINPIPSTITNQDNLYTNMPIAQPQQVLAPNPISGAKDPYYKNTDMYGNPITPNMVTTPIVQTNANMSDPYYKNTVQSTQSLLPTTQSTVVGAPIAGGTQVQPQNYTQQFSNLIQPTAVNTSGMSANEQKAIQPYISLENMLDKNNQQYAGIMGFVDTQTKDMLQKNRENLQNLYQQQAARVGNYYGDLGASTANTMANEQALAQAQASRSGATPNQLNLSMNQLSSKQLEDMTKIKGEEMKQYENLYNIYKNIEDQFITNYANSTDKNIVNTYKEILASKNSLLANMTEARRAIQQAEMQKAMNASGAKSSGTDISKYLQDLTANANAAAAQANSPTLNNTSTLGASSVLGL